MDDLSVARLRNSAIRQVRKTLYGRPGQSKSGGDVLEDKRAAAGLAIAIFEELTEFDRGREEISVSILKYPQLTPLFHKFFDLREDGLADFFRQRNERQAANQVAHLAETGVQVYRERICGIAANDIHIREVFVERLNKID